MFYSENQAFRTIGFLGWCPNINPAWWWEQHEGCLIWPYYVIPIIGWPGFVIITPYFLPYSTVFSNQRFSNCSSSMDVGFVKLLSDFFCRVALFNQCILSCVLMALVYTITWIHMWKQCVVFLQQTVTSKHTPSRCSFTNGADNYHIKTKNCNEMPNNCFTMYIFHNDVLTYPPVQ